MIPFFTTNLIWSEGIALLAIVAVLASIGTKIRFLFYLSLILLMFLFYFFRNPDRLSHEALADSSIILCPADGKIVDIQYDANGLLRHYCYKVSIFLSPFDVHVNWSPMGGMVQRIEYTQGSFQAAFLPKSSLLNEHNDIEIVSEDRSRTLLVRQIAGALARRIVCWASEGERILVGQKYGMIKFGSRVDIFLPDQIQLQVSLCQSVQGGQTVLARWKPVITN